MEYTADFAAPVSPLSRPIRRHCQAINSPLNTPYESAPDSPIPYCIAAVVILCLRGRNEHNTKGILAMATTTTTTKSLPLALTHKLAMAELYRLQQARKAAK